MSTERTMHKVDPKQVKVGDLMAFTYYTKVKHINLGGNELLVTDLKNNQSEITIRGKELIENSLSADQFHEEQKVSHTDAAKLLINSPHRPLTVCFVKKDGTDRTLRCRFLRTEDLMGRSMVENLEPKDDKDQIKQVDHRTINWLIVDGVKYTTK